MSYQTSQEIRAALEENGQRPHGTIRSATAEDLADAARRLGDDSLLVTALCELMNAYEYGAEQARLPVTLARMLRIHDQNPRAFAEWQTFSMHWHFKWVTTALLQLPDVPIQTVRDWVDQMGERYAAAGLKDQAVHAMRYHIAAHTGGDLDLAYEMWSARPRDEMSDCEACEARSRGEYYALRGQDARACDEWQPVLGGQITCAEEPASAAAEALAPMVRLGRLDEAASAHRTTYRQVRGNVNMAAQAGRHLEFCALTGNTPRGVEILGQSREYFSPAPGTLTDLQFLGGVQVLLARLVADGHGAIPVPGPAGAAHSAQSLLTIVTAQGAALAARFDARNGTSWIGDRHRVRCEQQPHIGEPLQLGLRGSASVPLRPVLVPPPPAADADRPETAAELLSHARELTELGRPDADSLWDRLGARLSDADADGTETHEVDGVPVDSLLRAELAYHRGYRRARSGQWPDARRDFIRARELFELAARPGYSVAALARSCWCALPPGASVDAATLSAAWAGLDEAMGQAGELLRTQEIKPDQYLGVIHCRVVAWTQHPPSGRDGDDATMEGQSGELRAEVELMRTEAVRLGRPHFAAVARTQQVHFVQGQGQAAAAEEALRDALSLVRESGRTWMLPTVCCLLAEALIRSGQPEESIGLVHEALTHAQAWPDEHFNHAGALMLLGDACLSTGDPQAAARHFADAAARLDRQNDSRHAVVARAALGRALLASQRPADAVAVLESLRDEQDEGLDRQQRAQARLDLGRGLRQLGEHRAAAEEFIWLADFVASWAGEQPIVAIVVGELAAALAAAGLWEQADAAVNRAMSIHVSSPQPAVICRMLRLTAQASMHIRGAGALDGTLGYLDQADEVNDQAAEVAGKYVHWPETAQTAELRARALAEAGRHDEALAAALASLCAYEIGGSETLPQQSEMTRVAALLQGQRLGQRPQAIDLLTPMIAKCESAGLGDQVARLAGLRDRLAKTANDTSASSS